MAGGTITLRPTRGPVVTLIVASPPDRGGGVGGWVGVQRSGRNPGKWWQAVPDDTMSIDCILDLDALPGIPLEGRIVQLKSLGKPRPDTGNEPAPIQISGDIQADDRARWWVMSDLKWGDRLFTQNGDGKLRRQHVSIDFELYSPLGEIEPLKVTRTRRTRGHRRRRVVIAKSRDTLRAIALRELGNPSRWDDLRKWNKLLRKVDPDAPLRRGTHVTIR